MKRRTGSLALGGLFLAGLGYTVGVLTAPKSGKETRRDIQRTVSRAKSEAERKLKALYGELGDLLEQGRKSAKSMSSKAKKELEKAAKAAQQAQATAKEVLSGLHEGESDDEDLRQAIKDADKAIANLKKYVKKQARG